jgi:hypothetical protein
MKYIKVKWIHDLADEPIWLYCELDNGFMEIRKVEIFSDGTAGFASSTERFGTTRLSLEPLPTLDEIASDAQFDPAETSVKEFEDIWSKRHDRQRE